ncbi:LTA synthase family protein, partial [Neisseria sp. P0009.S007]
VLFMPLKNQQRAASHLLKPQSDKILMIVAESWGQPDKQALQDAVLAKLSEQKDRFSVWEGGSFNFIGATVEGEMRELCSYSRVHGFG